MKNKNDDEYSDKLSYKIAHLIGSAVVKLIPLINNLSYKIAHLIGSAVVKLIPLIRKFNLRLVLGIPAVAMLLMMVYVEFLQNQDRNNELLYNALIPGKSTRDNFYAFERAHGLDNEPYWNGYLVEFVKPGYKPESSHDSFIIYLLRDPYNTKGIFFETLKSDLEYLCGTKWYESGADSINNIGQYELKHENLCIVQKADYSPDYEYSVYVGHQNRIK